MNTKVVSQKSKGRFWGDQRVIPSWKVRFPEDREVTEHKHYTGCETTRDGIAVKEENNIMQVSRRNETPIIPRSSTYLNLPLTGIDQGKY